MGSGNICMGSDRISAKEMNKSLKESAVVLSIIKGITCVSLVTGSIDILATCLFKETADLFKILETVKTIGNVDKLSWAEEVHDIPSKEIMILSSLVQESTNASTSAEGNNPNDTNQKETTL
jgi:hypothetical protein